MLRITEFTRFTLVVDFVKDCVEAVIRKGEEPLLRRSGLLFRVKYGDDVVAPWQNGSKITVR